MHHPCTLRLALTRFAFPSILLALAVCAPDLSMAQQSTSPFLTGATSLQSNARVAREYLVALPIELSPDQRLGLVRGFSQELSDRYQFAVDFAIHAPRDFPGSDPRNFHAHLLATTREVSTAGLGAKTSLEQSDANRRKLGLEPAISELLYVRERWATVTNEALRDAHLAVRIDHRTLEAQGIVREPQLRIPRVPYELERRGYRSVVAERMREDFAARVQPRLERAPAPAPTPASAQRSDHATAAADQKLGKSPSLEEIRREARESWLRLRQKSAESSAGRGETRDDDLAL